MFFTPFVFYFLSLLDDESLAIVYALEVAGTLAIATRGGERQFWMDSNVQIDDLSARFSPSKTASPRRRYRYRSSDFQGVRFEKEFSESFLLYFLCSLLLLFLFYCRL
jgi:hypothetical protein